jgi:endonuclease/exonuclease/phosphatase (EEP) superfamily protein YafD
MALLAAVTVLAIRFGSGAISLPVAPAEGGRREVVATWNLLADGRDVSRTMGALRVIDASVVGLQELSERMAGAIEADVALIARYPYRVMAPRPGVRGMGLLSAYPVLASGQLADPPLLWATLDLGVCRRLTVVDAHPLPARMRGLAAVPLDFDPTARDAAIGRIREVVDPFLSSGEPLLLLGDFNVTDRERAYAELTAGLADAQRAVGSWPASSWRPGFAIEWPFGLLRIDYLHAGPGVRPLSAAPDCTPSGSDHCLVRGVFELP